MIAALLAATALAADGPSIWGRQAVGVAGWPTGLLSNTLVEGRVPLHRSESVVFHDTYGGFGAQAMVSPAFLLVGPRLTFAPIDVFDVTLKGAHAWYFGNGLGLMPFDAVGGSSSSARDARADEGVASELWSASVEPTLKGKVWKIVVFDTWSIDYLVFERPAGVTSPYTYEPLRDLVVGWSDITFEHQAGVLYQALPGGDKPSLRFGPTFRDRWAHGSGDRSTTVGALVAARPGVKPAIPTIVGMALWYVDDHDYGGGVPFLAAQVRWDFERELGSAEKAP
ncbi:MAG: hypothetical protein Q8P41_28735 [Pseudomonadota bacterium]|nr:hypothetical protein [Pseudomonadota bacterium]